MKFARRVFFWSGVYGVTVLVPQYFFERKIGWDTPPAITHPEYFYGFLGVALAWQVAFFIIARDPVRFRALMIPAFLEKFSFLAANAVLFALGRVPTLVFGFGAIDFSLGLLFLAAYRTTRPGVV
jgi:hypothetical protein